MQHRKIYFVDFWKTFDKENNIFIDTLRRKYDITLDQYNPDFIFCSHFGMDFLHYQCPRILYLGEAKAPDFNLYDYALAFDYITFEDRYLRYPYYLFDKNNIRLALQKHIFSDETYLSKNNFCNFVVSNGSGADQIRNTYFEELSKYKQVDSGGAYRNNLPNGKPVADKLAFQRQYKFSIAFENSAFKGYTTEKIMDAWAAGTIPIYWGDPCIEKEFNSAAFINCNGLSIQEVIKQVIEIDQDQDKYLEMMKQPVLLNDSPVYKMLNDSYLENFLYPIFEHEPFNALRRNSRLTMWGKAYEHHISRWNDVENSYLGKSARNLLRKLQR